MSNTALGAEAFGCVGGYRCQCLFMGIRQSYTEEAQDSAED